MGKNYTLKILTGSGNFTVPAGVKGLRLYGKLLEGNFLATSGGSGPTGVAFRMNGSLWSWGQSTLGKLGDGTTTMKSSPVAVAGGHAFILVRAGTSGFYAQKSDGTLWAWGANTNGQLGDGSVTNQSQPYQVAIGHNFSYIAKVQSTSAMALKADGTAWGWGQNTHGQLGDNSIIPKSSPVAVIGGHLFVEITGGGGGNGFSAARKSDGSVWTWGRNNNGQLGDNSVVSKSSPVAVVGGHVFIKVVTGTENFCLGLKSDGTVWSWGVNTNGQLGDNTVVPKSSPVAVVGGHLFVDISAGDFAVAQKIDGSLWTWGQNDIGQLGDNTVVPKSSPVAVVGGHVFEQFEAGTNHCLARKSDGTLWGWGNGSFGGLGDNSIVSKSSPVAVVGPQDFNSVPNTTQLISFLEVTPGDVIAYDAEAEPPTFGSLASPYMLSEFVLEYFS